MLSLVLSFVLYGHSLNAPQTVGLVLSVAAMSANFFGKVSDDVCSYVCVCECMYVCKYMHFEYV